MLVSNIVFALFTSLVMVGCSSSAKTHYYTLQAPSANTTGSRLSPLRIVIGPISLPEAVDRTQFVVRTGENTVDISDTQRWAEPLKSGIARVLESQLMQILNAAADEGDIRVVLDVLSFDSVLGKNVTIEARWTVTRAGSSKPLRGHSLITESLSGNDYADIAAGHARALLQISREIAAALR